MNSPSSLRRRARPLLGTLVEITLAEADPQLAEQGFTRAFGAVEEVHRLMSAHDPASDVSVLSMHAHRTPQAVHPHTLAVLRLALAVHAESKGIFDITVGHLMANAGHLPALPLARRTAQGSSADIVIHACGTVHFERPLRIDLGGIAKGHAVDCAVLALQSLGIRSGLVNAGGDMRAFGPVSYPVHLRFAGGVRCVAMLNQGALAASCSSGDTAAPVHADGRSGVFVRRAETVMVHAASAAVADALTKVAMVCASTADSACLAMQAEWRAFDTHSAQHRFDRQAA